MECNAVDELMLFVQIIKAAFPSMSCLPQTIGGRPAVTRAVIPLAGIARGLFPASKALSPGLFPIRDHDGKLKPAVLILVEQALSAGIEEVGDVM